MSHKDLSYDRENLIIITLDLKDNLQACRIIKIIIYHKMKCFKVTQSINWLGSWDL